MWFLESPFLLMLFLPQERSIGGSDLKEAIKSLNILIRQSTRQTNRRHGELQGLNFRCTEQGVKHKRPIIMEREYAHYERGGKKKSIKTINSNGNKSYGEKIKYGAGCINAILTKS